MTPAPKPLESIMENMPESKFTLSPAEAARAMGVTLDYVYKLIWAGKIRAEKIDGKWRVDATEEPKQEEKKGLGEE